MPTQRKCGKCKENVPNTGEVVCIECYTNVNIVVNRMLTYVNSHRSSSSTMQIKTAILNFFSQDDIAEARQMMIDNIREVIPDFPHLNKKRTDSVNRQASDIMVDDIQDMFKALDNVDDQWLVPRFMCDDVSKLPGSPEAAGNMMSMYEDISCHERKLLQLQEAMTKVIQDVSRNHADITQLKTKVPPSVNGNFVQTNGSKGPNTKQNQVRDKQRLRSVIDDSDNGNQAQNAGVTAEPSDDGDRDADPGGSGEQKRTGYANAVLSDSTSNNDVESENRDFHKVGRNNVRRPNKGAGNVLLGERPAVMKKKDTRTGGTAEDHGVLIAGPDTFQVQITNVSPSLAQEDIVNYVESKGDLKPSNIEDITSDGWNTKRFLLTFEYKHHDVIMAQDFWPRRIYFKRWFTHKQPNNTVHG